MKVRRMDKNDVRALIASKTGSDPGDLSPKNVQPLSKKERERPFVKMIAALGANLLGSQSVGSFDAKLDGLGDAKPRKLACYRDNIVVLYDWIRDERRELKSAGGIILPNTGRKPKDTEACQALVLASGPGTFLDTFISWEQEGGSSFVGSRTYWQNEVKAGDRVLVERADCGDAIMIDGLEHRIIRMTNVLGVIE